MKMIVLIVVLLPVHSYAVPRAYQLIGAQYGVPAEVFYAVALQESGHLHNGRFIPWPWTLNIENTAFYFETRMEAEVALMLALNTYGFRRVAIGLGQIYWPSHNHRFSAPVDALAPSNNLRYSAQLLAAEYQYTIRHGRPNWWDAVGRYHSPSRPDLANDYKQRVYSRCRYFSTRCNEYGQLNMKDVKHE